MALSTPYVRTTKEKKDDSAPKSKGPRPKEKQSGLARAVAISAALHAIPVGVNLAKPALTELMQSAEKSLQRWAFQELRESTLRIAEQEQERFGHFNSGRFLIETNAIHIREYEHRSPNTLEAMQEYQRILETLHRVLKAGPNNVETISEAINEALKEYQYQFIGDSNIISTLANHRGPCVPTALLVASILYDVPYYYNAVGHRYDYSVGLRSYPPDPETNMGHLAPTIRIQTPNGVEEWNLVDGTKIDPEDLSAYMPYNTILARYRARHFERTDRRSDGSSATPSGVQNVDFDLPTPPPNASPLPGGAPIFGGAMVHSISERRRNERMRRQHSPADAWTYQNFIALGMDTVYTLLRHPLVMPQSDDQSTVLVEPQNHAPLSSREKADLSQKIINIEAFLRHLPLGGKRYIYTATKLGLYMSARAAALNINDLQTETVAFVDQKIEATRQELSEMERQVRDEDIINEMKTIFRVNGGPDHPRSYDHIGFGLDTSRMFITLGIANPERSMRILQQMRPFFEEISSSNARRNFAYPDDGYTETVSALLFYDETRAVASDAITSMSLLQRFHLWCGVKRFKTTGYITADSGTVFYPWSHDDFFFSGENSLRQQFSVFRAITERTRDKIIGFRILLGPSVLVQDNHITVNGRGYATRTRPQTFEEVPHPFNSAEDLIREIQNTLLEFHLSPTPSEISFIAGGTLYSSIEDIPPEKIPDVLSSPHSRLAHITESMIQRLGSDPDPATAQDRQRIIHSLQYYLQLRNRPSR